MAEGILKQLLMDKKRTDVQVQSAGISAGKGFPASVNAVAALAEQQIDITAHQSQPITKSLVEDADVILVMEVYHKECIQHAFPTAAKKIKLLKEFGIHDDNNPDIQDPIGGSLAAYRYSAKEINRCLIDFVKEYIEGGE